MGRARAFLLLVAVAPLALRAEEPSAPAWRLLRVVTGDALSKEPEGGVTKGLVRFEVVRADARGGEVTMEVHCGDASAAHRGPHWRRFSCTWTFDEELTRVRPGDTIAISAGIHRTGGEACDSGGEGTPFMDLQAGGTVAILAREREDHDLDPDVFAHAVARPLGASNGGSLAAETEGHGEVRVGAAAPISGRRGCFDVVTWTTRNCTVHAVYLFEAVAGPTPAELDARKALRISVGLAPSDSALDEDKDGKVTAKDAFALLRRGAGR